MKKYHFIPCLLALAVVAMAGVIEVPEAPAWMTLPVVCGGTPVVEGVACSLETDGQLEWLTTGSTSDSVNAGSSKGQSFRVDATSTITMAKVHIAESNEGYTLSANIRIETDSSGPSGTLVDANAAVTLADGDITDSFAWIDAEFPDTFQLSSGVTYWLVIAVPNVDGGAIDVNIQTPSAYADGEYSDLSSYDMNFEIWGCAD